MRKLEHWAKPSQRKKRPLSICLSDNELLTFLKLEGTSSCVLGHARPRPCPLQLLTGCCRDAGCRNRLLPACSLQADFTEHRGSKTSLPFITSGRASKSQLQTDFNSTRSPHRQQSAIWPSVLYCGRERLNSNPYLFALRIQSRRCFIEKQNVRLSDKGACYGDALLLPTRQLSPFVSHSGAVFLWAEFGCYKNRADDEVQTQYIHRIYNFLIYIIYNIKHGFNSQNPSMKTNLWLTHFIYTYECVHTHTHTFICTYNN